MPPDLNTLPASSPPPPPPPPPSASSPAINVRPQRISLNSAESGRAGGTPPSPRSPPLSSLQAAATINRGLHHNHNQSPSRGIPSLERRRSSLMNNLSLNDPTIPAPGEMQPSHSPSSASPRLGRRSMAMATATADPLHQRQPSLGELHQELETEQEAQVNRLLHMIRQQHDHLTSLHRQQHATEPSPERTPPGHTAEASPRALAHPARPPTLSRRSSRMSAGGAGSSRGHSPALRPASSNAGGWAEDFMLPGGARDECAFYQAETQTLTRENQMLKHRIRELGKCEARSRPPPPGPPCRHADSLSPPRGENAEKQIADLSAASPQHLPAGAAPHGPAHNSPLATPPTPAPAPAPAPPTFTAEPAPALSAPTKAD